MKIAILTYWSSSDNYGQLLQCFALQHFLRKKGHDAYLVRYRPVYPNSKPESYTLLGFLKKISFSKLIHFRKYIELRRAGKYELSLVNKNTELNKYRNFNIFREQYIHQSECIYTSIDELQHNPPTADIYICGSDQVWHDFLSLKNVAGWYLQFGDEDVKRISYAASIGRGITSDEEHLFKEYLSKFDAISLREQSAVDYCKRIGFSDAQLVCDPTLLLDMSYYKDTLKINESSSSKPYAFVYTLNIRTKEELYWNRLKSIIDKRGLQICSVGSSGYIQARNIIPEIENIPATIHQWLSLIANSELVVTSSFHGTVFSVLMHKPFAAFLLDGIYLRANDRITHFLNFLGLSSQICSNEEDMLRALNNMINWNIVDEKLSVLRNSGVTYLDSVLYC